MLREGHSTIAGWFATRRLRRRFRETRAFALDTLPEDTYGRIEGAARPFEAPLLVAPLSQRPCLCWILETVETVEHPREDGPYSRTTVDRGSVPFVVEHAGARAIVDPAGATVALAYDHAADSRRLAHAAGELAATLERALGGRSFSPTRVQRVREAVIEVGDLVTVLGAGRREPDPAAASSYRAAGPTRLRLEGSEEHPICITDDPKIP